MASSSRTKHHTDVTGPGPPGKVSRTLVILQKPVQTFQWEEPESFPWNAAVLERF